MREVDNYRVGLQETEIYPGCLDRTRIFVGGAGPCWWDLATRWTVEDAFIFLSSWLKSRGSSISVSTVWSWGVGLRAREGVTKGEGVGEGDKRR